MLIMILNFSNNEMAALFPVYDITAAIASVTSQCAHWGAPGHQSVMLPDTFGGWTVETVQQPILGPVSISDKTSYRKIS